jgi:hypothetical protein
VKLRANHLAQVVGHLDLQHLERDGEGPTGGGVDEPALCPQLIDQRHHEQWISVGLLVDQTAEATRKACRRKSHGEICFDIVAGQIREGDLAALAMEL